MGAEKRVRHVDYYFAEFISGVSGLSGEEIGIYWMICSFIMASGGPIARTDIRFKQIATGKAAMNRAIDRLIELGKLTETSGLLGQKRAENELKSAQNRIEKSAENGKKGGRPRKENKDLQEPSGFSAGKPTPTPEPTPEPEDKIPPVLPSVGHPPGEPTPAGQADLLGDAPKAKPTTKPKPAQATRIPDDWEANEALRRFGLEQLGDAARLDREIDKFRDFWKAKAGPDARKMDWDATFKNWCRRAAEEQPRHGQRSSAVPIVIDGKPKPPGPDYRAGVLGAASGTLESALTRRAVDPFRTPGR